MRWHSCRDNFVSNVSKWPVEKRLVNAVSRVAERVYKVGRARERLDGAPISGEGLRSHLYSRSQMTMLLVYALQRVRETWSMSISWNTGICHV